MYLTIWQTTPRWLLSLALALTALGEATSATAQTSRLGFGQFTHDRWMVYEGAPAGMKMVAQTHDGWIWVSAAAGLFRFDGITFERIPVPAGSPLERASAGPLLVTRTGELWVGYAQSAGVAVYRSGRLHHVPMPQPPQVIGDLVETRDGAIWATSSGDYYSANRLWRLMKGRWEDLSKNSGLEDGYHGRPCATADGSLWIPLFDPRGASRFLHLPPGGRRFQRSQFKALPNVRCFSDRRGQLWITDAAGTRLVISSDRKAIERPSTLPMVQGIAAAVWGEDSSGGFWGRTKESTGIYYIPDATGIGRKGNHMPDRFLASDGLSSNLVHHLFVDREDNGWVVTEAGLDRFRGATILQEPLIKRNRGRFGISQNGDALYVDAHDGLFQLSPGAPRKLLTEEAMGQCPARHKGVWVIYEKRIVHFHNGVQQSIPNPVGMGLWATCAEDRLGRLWAGTIDNELIWHDGRGWHAPPRVLPKIDAWTFIVTPSGDIAYVAVTGELVQMIGDKVSRIPLAPYDLGMITRLAAGRRDIFISGNNGLLRIRGKQIARLDWRRFPWAARLRDLIQTPRGETWMMERYSVSQVATADLDRAFDDPNAPLQRVMLDLRDGLGAMQLYLIQGPQMAVGGDGRVWLLNDAGPSFVDPEQFPRKAPPPPVVIRSLSSAGSSFHDPSSLVLQPGTHALDIGYTALSYAYPERVRFRYRLDGVDDAWVEADSRRFASYANLGPGRYRFRVIASDDRRNWSDPGAVLDIEIPPTFLQSRPFELLCVLAMVGLLWLAYSLRLRAVAGRIRLTLAERTAERERIARELHDTLLQGIQGLMLRFQIVADRIDDPETRRSLDNALDRADAVVVEGRERVRDLRGEAEPGELAHELRKLAGSVIKDEMPRIDLSVNDEEWPLHSLVKIEALRIAEEAIWNAVLHAAPGPISLCLGYDRNQFRLSVRDTGPGIPDAVLGAGKRSGHFGLVGMRERAKRIGGELGIFTGEGEGTEIILTVPARTAYLGGRRNCLESIRVMLVKWSGR
jgi:signal transduction histidine kinase